MHLRGTVLSTGFIAAIFATSPGTAGAAPTEPNTLNNAVREAQTCQNCHTFDNAAEHGGEPLYAPFVGWSGSMMANSARDPVFWAGVAIASQDEETPGTTTECVRCHSPRAFLEGRGDAIAMDQLLPSDLDGVTCELCHRMIDDGETGPGNAHYTIDDVAVGGTVPRRGPWTYDGAFTPPHPWIQDSYVGSSRMCGTCHDVSTPRERVDDNGVSMGTPFNEQRTYSEWLNSAFSTGGADFRSCQDCHMPAVADMPGCQDAVNSFSHPDGGRRHDLSGANVFMISLLRDQYGDPPMGSGELPSLFFDLSIERTNELLATAATLELEAPTDVHLGEGLDGLVATVTNESGHKLPTGYSEGRVMWLEVVATYGDQTVWTSGEWVAGQGLQEDAQARIYRAVAEDYATGETFHLLLNNHWVEDTRIPPRGLQPDPQTDPVGDRYALTAEGTWPNYDVASYAFAGAPDIADATPADTSDDALDVRVRLLYVINTPEYIEFLANENSTNQAGNDVAMLFDTSGGAPPIVLAEQSLSIPIVGFGSVATDSSGGVDDTSDDTASNDDTPQTDGGTTPPTTTATATDTDTTPMTDDGGGGCNCRTTDRKTPSPLLLTLLALGFSRRRRRNVTAAR